MGHESPTSDRLTDWSKFNDFSLFSSQSWVSAWLLEGGPNAPCFSLHSPSCLVSHYLSHVSLLREGQTNTKKSQFPRVYETFWFAHGQFMKRWDLKSPINVRYGLERRNLKIPPVIPLDPEASSKSLGPGYKVGYFGSGFDLSDRSWSKSISCPGGGDFF